MQKCEVRAYQTMKIFVEIFGICTLILGALIQVFGVYTRIFVAHFSGVKGALVLKL